jgi:hypothetical protein
LLAHDIQTGRGATRPGLINHVSKSKAIVLMRGYALRATRTVSKAIVLMLGYAMSEARPGRA